MTLTPPVPIAVPLARAMPEESDFDWLYHFTSSLSD